MKHVGIEVTVSGSLADDGSLSVASIEEASKKKS